MARILDENNENENYEEFEVRQQMEAQRRERENREFEEGLMDSEEQEEEYDEEVHSEEERGFHSRRSSERHVSIKRPRTAGARREDEFKDKDLKNLKLSAKDFGSQKSSKKGRYGITVPQPFQFDLRENTRPKSIAERKLERMITEKKIEEEGLIKH